MVDHAEFLWLQADRTGLALCAYTFRPLRVARRTIPSYPVKGFVERRHKRALQLRLVRRSVDLAQIRVEGKVLDLLFGEVFRIVRLEGHAIVAHAFRSMCAHLRITVTRNLPILFVQHVIERGLLDNFPRVLDCSLWAKSDSLILRERRTVQTLLAIRSALPLLFSSLLSIPKKQLIAMPFKPQAQTSISTSARPHHHFSHLLHHSETHLSPTFPIEIPSSVFNDRSSPPVPTGLLERTIDEGSMSCGSFSVIWHGK